MTRRTDDVSRRSLLRAALATPFAASLLARAGAAAEIAALPQAPDTGSGPFTLPPLPYKYEALEPTVDKQTMTLHHDKHHAAYVKNLNDALAKHPEALPKMEMRAGELPGEYLLRNLDKVPEDIRTAVRNNGGGHANHTLFWTLMKPGGGGAPTGAIADALKGTFGSVENFQTAFNDAGAKRFGSGWAWLVARPGGKLEVISTPNQDSPVLAEYGGAYPILGNDVWEHAYYLKYNNRRPDYLKAWWSVVNWDAVNARLASAPK
jgi:Fe-Mn family superoxide dismutase